MTELPTARSTGLFARVEDGIVTLAALGVIVLPLAEVVLRRLFGTGIPGAAPFTSHLTLIVGLVGAAIAAREGKLLALATGTLLPEGWLRDVAKVISALVGSMVSTVLALGGMRLLQVHRDAAKPIALGIPVWVVDLAFPIAFGLIAVRLVWQASPKMTCGGLPPSGSWPACGSAGIPSCSTGFRRGP